jgi:hypothetical protein
VSVNQVLASKSAYVLFYEINQERPTAPVEEEEISFPVKRPVPEAREPPPPPMKGPKMYKKQVTAFQPPKQAVHLGFVKDAYDRDLDTGKVKKVKSMLSKREKKMRHKNFGGSKNKKQHRRNNRKR